MNGEPDTARLILRDLVNATVGFETQPRKTPKPSKSLHRMLSLAGNPMGPISLRFMQDRLPTDAVVTLRGSLSTV
jgi:hypothetical protein